MDWYDWLCVEVGVSWSGWRERDVRRAQSRLLWSSRTGSTGQTEVQEKEEVGEVLQRWTTRGAL